MSIFSNLDRMSSGIIDVVNSQPALYTPMRDKGAIGGNPNVMRKTDPDRESKVIEVVFEYNSIEFGMELGVRKSYREANDLRGVSVGRTPDVSIDRKWFANGDQEPRQGDLITLLLPDRITPDPKYPPFEVMDNQRDGLARFVCRLTQLGSQG